MFPYKGNWMAVFCNCRPNIGDYVVQFAIITDRYNSLFPLNIFIVFALICIAAYGLKVVTSVYLSVMSKDAFDGKAILKI